MMFIGYQQESIKMVVQQPPALPNNQLSYENRKAKAGDLCARRLVAHSEGQFFAGDRREQC